MSERPLELALLGCFLLFAEVMIIRDFYRIWFRFPEFQQNLIKRNERYAESGWPFASWANQWIAHPNYQLFARMTSLLVLVLCAIGLLGVLINLLQLSFLPFM